MKRNVIKFRIMGKEIDVKYRTKEEIESCVSLLLHLVDKGILELNETEVKIEESNEWKDILTYWIDSTSIEMADEMHYNIDDLSQ